MKIWILLGVLSVCKVSSVFPSKEESKQLETVNITRHKVIKYPQNDSFPINNETNGAESIAKNAVLIIVENSQGEDVWRNFKENHLFSIEGFLSSCKKSHGSNISLFLGHNDNCECEKLLKKNINELMMWAQLIKGINTAIISSNNLIFSSFVKNANPIFDYKKFLKNKNKPTLFQQRPELEDSWHLNNTNSQPTSSLSVLNMNSSTNRSNVYDAFRNFISKISRMHSLIFTTFLKIIGIIFIHNNISTQHKSMFPIGSPKFIDFISNTLMDLKLASNSKGFLFIVVTPGDQLSIVYQIIESQVPLNETLIAVTNECSKDNQAVPYYASGFKPHFLLNTTTIFEVPIALKSTLDGCYDIYNNKTFPLTKSVKDGLKKRKIRSGDDDKIQQDNEKTEESDADSNENEDFSGNGDLLNSDRNSSDLDSAKDNLSSSHRTISSLAFKFIFTALIMMITHE